MTSETAVAYPYGTVEVEQLNPNFTDVHVRYELKKKRKEKKTNLWECETPGVTLPLRSIATEKG